MKRISSKVWVIDDNPTYQTYLQSFLNTIGYSAEIFPKATADLVYRKEKPEFIIVDRTQEENGPVFEYTQNHVVDVKANVPVIYISEVDKTGLLTEAGQGADFESACLIHLKHRIERIEKIKVLKRQRRNYRVLIYSMVGLLWAVGLWFFLRNISL